MKKKKVDLLTGKKLPDSSNFSSIQQRLGILGINDDMYKDKAEYFEEELKNALAKLQRLEKDIIKLKKDKVILQERISELEEEYLSEKENIDNSIEPDINVEVNNKKIDKDTLLSLLKDIKDPRMFARMLEGMHKNNDE